jgi:hypothetical protein
MLLVLLGLTRWGRVLIGNGLEQAWFEHGSMNLVLPGFTGASPAWARLPIEFQVPTERNGRVRGWVMLPRMGLRLLTEF